MIAKAPRILLLSDAASFHTERFARQLKRQGCRVVTASLEEGSMRSIRLKRLGPVKSFHYLLAVPQLKGIIKRFKPDVINAHYACGYGFIAVQARGDKGAPIILNIWGSDVLVVPHKSSQHKLKTRRAIEGAEWVFGDSEYLMRRAGEIGSIKNSQVVPWGIEAQYLKLHKESYRLSRPLQIITPRVHEDVYNNEFILKALTPLLQQGKVELTIPDFGSKVEKFRVLAGGLQRSGVHLYRKLDRYQFLKFMAGHDVYLSASRSDSSPASLIEAMALGLIPVAADTDGVKEWLTPESGFRFEPDNVDRLCSLISNMAVDANPYEEMRKKNLERVKREAIFEKNVSKQVEIMKSLVKGID